MYINRTTNRISAQNAYAKTSNAVRQDSFGDVLKKSSARDTFNASAVSNTSVAVGSLIAANTQAKLDIIAAELKNTDYSDMSKAEIYADIEKRYENAFDDYYASRAVGCCEDFTMVNNQFVEDIRAYVGYCPTKIVNEARGYAGMTFDEIEASIKEKYAGKTGFVDQLNLLGELYTSGVLTNKMGWANANAFLSHLSISIDMRSFNEINPISKAEWLRRVEKTGVSSPFTFLLNNPYFSMYKEMYKTIVDDILFGIADNEKN